MPLCPALWLTMLLMFELFVVMPMLSTASTLVRIGGLFAPLTPSGHRDMAQAEHLAAFIMAVNDINNKSDGIYDELLPDIKLVYSVQGESPLIGATKRFLNLVESFNGAPLFTVISALNNEDMMVVAQLAAKTGTQIMTTVSDSGQYYDINWCPTIANIAALQSHEGAAIQNLICGFTSKVLLFVGTSVEDISMR
jgi:hypothetical protein